VVSEWATRRRRAEKASDQQLQKVPSARTIARLMTTARDHMSKADMITTHSLDKAVFVGSTLQEVNRKADDWWMRQKGVREVHRSKTSGGFSEPSLRDADQFTVTIHYEPEK
jgi:hypothetical protein